MVKQALRQLLSDFLSAILFLAVYGLSGDLFAAAAIAVAAGLAQLAGIWLTGRRVEPMQWMSLGLVVVLGGATMLTQSPRFIMLKPTIVHLAVAAVMLRRGWMIRYLPEIVLQNVPEPAIVTAGYAWAALLAAIGLVNLIIALHFDFATWAWFISVGAVGAKLVAFALQYGVFRTIIRQRIAPSAA
jgi:intracellular septation protein A